MDWDRRMTRMKDKRKEGNPIQLLEIFEILSLFSFEASPKLPVVMLSLITTPESLKNNIGA